MSVSNSDLPQLSRTPQLVIDEVQEKALVSKILWKLDIHVLPLVGLLFLSSFIDRSSIGNAKIAGLERDAHLSGNQLNILLSVFYVAYVIVELPSNLILKRVKANRWLAFSMVMWGIVNTMTGLVHSFSQLFAARFFLGLFEGGLTPGVVLYLSTLYKRHELSQRIGIFFVCGSIAGAFGGALASVITKMDGIGGLSGWRWIFILEGIATVLLAILTWILLPADVATATFFTDGERSLALARLKAADTVDSMDILSLGPTSEKTVADEESEKNLTMQLGAIYYDKEEFEWLEVRRALKDPQLWFASLSNMGVTVSVYSLSYFLPSIVAGLGYSGAIAQLRSCPPFVPAAVATVAVAVISDKVKLRGPFVLLMLPVAMIGYIIAIVAINNTQRYIAVFLVAIGGWACAPTELTIIPNNMSGHYKRATASAIQVAASGCGGLIGPFLYTADQAPHYVRGHSVALAFIVMAWVFMAANVAYCMWENKARAEGRRQSNIETYRELWNAGETRAPIGDRHPEFRNTL